MILSFADDATAQVFQERKPRRFPADILSRALSKLRQLDVATQIQDLRVPPGNRLEALKGNRLGQHSIRINDQWRVCFVWQEADEKNNVIAGVRYVEITDYH